MASAPVNDNSHPSPATRLRALLPWALALLGVVSLVIWITQLGCTLVNDEYAALDYAYRSLHLAGFYPTPHRLHKPLAVLTALLVLPAGPMGYELVTAAWAGALVGFCYLAVRRAWGEAAAAVAALLLASNPDLFLNVAYGITNVPLLAGAFICIHVLLGLDQGRRGLWRYALTSLAIGLLRPDAWLFGLPLALAFWPRRRSWGYARFLLAAGLIALAPAIWFGKDWLINGSLLHSVHVAAADKTVGLAKVNFTAGEALGFFPKHIVPRISWPTFLCGLAGAGWFLIRRRGAGLLHPLFLFPLLISAFVWLLIMTGVYPIQRYFYFTTVFLLVFAAYLGVETMRWVRKVRFPWSWVGAGVIAALLGVHLFLAERRFAANYQELEHEAQIQREMHRAADLLQARIPAGERPLILLPARRDEELDWAFRDREIPNTLSFREAYYYQFTDHYSFINFSPRWILYIDKDFHWHWVADEFAWLNFQDHTEIQGVKVDLFFHTDLIRVFKTAFPAAWRPPPPPPPLY